MAYGSTSIIENLGTVFVYWLLFFAFALSCLCANCIFCCFRRVKGFNRCIYRIKKDLFWSAFIRFGIETYMEVAIAFQINVINYLNDKNMNEEHGVHNNVSFILALILGAYTILFPIISIGFLIHYHWEIVMEQKSRTKYINRYSTNKSLHEMDQTFTLIRKFGTLFSDVNSKTTPKLLYYPIFLLRRLLLAIILVKWVD